MKTRRELIVEQAMALQLAAVNNPRHEGKGGEAVARLCVRDAERLADALLTSDTIDTADAYTVPKAVGDAWVEDCDEFLGESTNNELNKRTRPFYDCLKAQQQEARQ